MLAFYTVYKNTVIKDGNDLYYGIEIAKHKQSLQAFGGAKTIEEFRKGFLCISDYDWVEKGIFENPKIKQWFCNNSKGNRIDVSHVKPRHLYEEDFIYVSTSNRRIIPKNEMKQIHSDNITVATGPRNGNVNRINGSGNNNSELPKRITTRKNTKN
jgi:hypothetical protein